MKAILIKQCSDSLMWYRGHVGKVVEYVREDSDTFWSREPEGYANIILKRDAVLIEVTEQGKQLLVEQFFGLYYNGLMKIIVPPIKMRDPVARDLRSAKYRLRVERNKTAYTRKPKHRERTYDVSL